MNRLRNLGPGLLVAAAFIGPGTVTTASVAGAGTGYALLWALAFSIIATIILQEMSARLGIVSREGLGEALRTTFDNALVKVIAVVLVVSAIGIGTAAFETGNITGAASGLASIGGFSSGVWSGIVGVAAFALLASGVYKVIERVLVALVIVMSVVFLLTAVIVQPNVGDILAGLFAPGIPEGSLVTVIALVGTTVVTYNFFLHSSSVQDKWPESVPTDEALSESRFDTTASVILGGIITLAIIVTGAAAFFGSDTEIETAADMALQLEPLAGAGGQDILRHRALRGRYDERRYGPAGGGLRNHGRFRLGPGPQELEVPFGVAGGARLRHDSWPLSWARARPRSSSSPRPRTVYSYRWSPYSS